MNTVHTFHHSILNMNLNIILPSRSSSSKCSQSFRFSYQPLTAQSVVTRSCTGWAVVQFSAEAREFSVVQHILTGSEAHLIGTGGKVDRWVKVTTHFHVLKSYEWVELHLSSSLLYIATAWAGSNWASFTCFCDRQVWSTTLTLINW